MQLKLFLVEKFGDNNQQVGLAETLLDLLGLFSSGIFCSITGCYLCWDDFGQYLRRTKTSKLYSIESLKSHTPELYSGGARFEPWLWHQLTWHGFPGFSKFIVTNSNIVPWLGHDCYLGNPLLYLIHYTDQQSQSSIDEISLLWLFRGCWTWILY